MEADPLVTVVVRSMDRPQLAAALASLAAQDHPAVEILVVDATGGRHGPLPRLDLVAGHSIRLVSSGQRLPRAQAADLGLVSASGEWITFLDDDDTCEPGHISGLVDAARATPSALVVYGCGRLLDAEGRLDHVYGRPFNRALLYFGPLFYWQASLIRTRVRDLGCRFDAKFDVCEDRDFLAQIASHGEFAFVPHLATFNYRPDLGTSGTGKGPNRDHGRVARFEQLVRAKWAGAAMWHGEHALVKCRRGARALNAGDHSLARQEFAAALAAYPDDPNALHGLARIALAEGDRAKAEKHVRQAIAVNPRISAFHATLAATGARVEETALGRAASVSRMAACPCGSGRKFKACCGRPDVLPPKEDDGVTALCAEARQALNAGNAASAFETLQRAAAIRCDAIVGSLLQAACAKLVEPEAEASLWSTVRAACALHADRVEPPPSRRILVVGESERAFAAASQLQPSLAATADAVWDSVPSLDRATGTIDEATCVVFCQPDDVPAHGVSGPSPGRALVLASAQDAAPIVRALARLAEGWPRARLDYPGISL